MEHDSRFTVGAILYFSPFYFSNGDSPKNKYFLVLHCDNQNVILASLPTSQDHVPNTIEKKHGCIDNGEINFNCYYFESGRVVCSNGYSFPKATYVYGFRLQQFELATFIVQECNNKTVIDIKGYLLENELKAIKNCLKNSSSVKHKYKKIL